MRENPCRPNASHTASHGRILSASSQVFSPSSFLRIYGFYYHDCVAGRGGVRARAVRYGSLEQGAQTVSRHGVCVHRTRSLLHRTGHVR